jgi:hypothetical protein
MSAGYLNLDLPDPDTVYKHYLVTCKMLGINFAWKRHGPGIESSDCLLMRETLPGRAAAGNRESRDHRRASA